MAVMLAGSVGIADLFPLVPARTDARAVRRKQAPDCWPPACAGRALVAESEHGDAGGRDNEETPMDWDDVRPEPKPGAAIGENLGTLSVGELEVRIAEFEREIARVKTELEKKRRHEDAASALFKR
jgi:uncharacterized small protein (DUF1192 family)